jgi:hypothetical protein
VSFHTVHFVNTNLIVIVKVDNVTGYISYYGKTFPQERIYTVQIYTKYSKKATQYDTI